ncbi:DNA ligase-like protein [Thermochaetoides thermophila DSM 1495]|uniref:DNA ligase n=1 Tax=Chaetomium thermophilum (strain DSM 1495 / CBS 144.50 / IMI 039719) TaxID=759272 RepID=G0S2Z6_CHATD|nr:DNA ligase-like protein [Thermochaetoides thermophila DSM 1495]EGS22379.1 DNA ligase-like protein [Thermochaetoides thermophila DSM 1495]
MPPKKRKLNNASEGSTPARTLDYFFGKQNQKSSPRPSSTPDPTLPSTQIDQTDQILTDEKLAQKLQAEFDAEARVFSASQQPPEPVQPQVTSPKKSAQADAAPDTTKLSTPKPTVAQNILSLSATPSSDDPLVASLPLDENPLTFAPSKCLPGLLPSWTSESGAPYALLTRCFTLVNNTQSRIKIVDTLTNTLRLLIEGDPDSLLPAVWLSTNAIAPPWVQGMELGIGGAAISKALKTACGLDNRALKALYDKVGDAGDVAFEAKKKGGFTFRKPKPLTIKGVYQSLVKIAKAQGPGSGETKQRIVDRLLQDARGGEESRAFLLSIPPNASYNVPYTQEELRKLKKDSLAAIYAKTETLLKTLFARHPDYNALIPALLNHGISSADILLEKCGLTLHTPLRPMLGSITRDLAEVLSRLEGRAFACEYKYDGQRAQVHCSSDGHVSIYSRHLENITGQYPDLVALIPQIKEDEVEGFILEGEVVAVDKVTGALMPFQTLAGRGRKDVDLSKVKVDVCLFAFDLMYLNGKALLEEPFRRRRELLRTKFKEVPGKFTWVKSQDATSEDAEAIQEFFKKAVEDKCEGIMVKLLDPEPGADLTNAALGNDEDPALPDPDSTPSPSKKGSKPSLAEKKPRRKPLLSTYQPDKRLESWLKVKKDYTASHSDTLDLVPIAAWHGQGRKARWWSPILLAVRNDETGALEAVCKCMSGFTDAFYRAMREFYDDGEVTGERKNTHPRRPGWIEYSGPEPDVWFEPCEVWEVAFADVTVSPTYTAGMGMAVEDRGLSLRFPRFLRKREDKGVEEASSSEVLVRIWRKQMDRGNGKRHREEAEGVEIEEE